MTDGKTSHPSPGLWTGLIMLLLLCSGSVHSQSEAALKEAATSPRAATTDSQSGSDVAPLHKVVSLVEVPTTTLKSVVERSEVSLKAASFGGKIPVSDSGELDDRPTADDPAGKSEKPDDEKVARVEEKREADVSPEFDEKEIFDDTHELDEDGDHEPTTPRAKKAVQPKNVNPEDSEEKEIEIDVKNDEKTKPEVGYSYVGDTNVNYNDKKTVKPAKDEDVLDNDAKDLKSTLENATNVIASDDAADTRREKGKGPKAQVEIVKNSTLSKVQRLTEVPDVADDEKKVAESSDSAERENNTKVSTTGLLPGTEELESARRKTDNSSADGEVTRTLSSPKGRTISFGGTNEFVTNENKSREGGGNDQPVGVDLTKEILPEHKTPDFKPYPYAKTTGSQLSNGSEGEFSSPGGSRVAESTEESSALENTIGQRQQEKKFVVTESSVDLDNSIHQYKPTYFKRSGNASRIQSSVDSPSSAVTSSQDDKTTPTTQPTLLGSAVTSYRGNLRVSNTENDVPLGKDDDTKTSVGIKETSSGIDFTGNGITEEVIVAIDHSAPSTIDVNPTGSSAVSTTSIFRAAEDTKVQKSTERIATLSDDPNVNIDIQTDAEDSMMKISTLNVTEGSTRIPSAETATSIETTIPTLPTTSPVFSTSASSTEFNDLVTSTISESSTAVRPRETPQLLESTTVDSSAESTTSKIEYEFVGLTESTVSQKYIASSESPNAVTEDRETTSSTAPSISELSMSSTSDPVSEFSTTSGDSSINTDTTGEITGDLETTTEAVTFIAEGLTSEDSTTSMSTLDFSGIEETTTSMNDNFETTAITDNFSTTEINEALETTTEEATAMTKIPIDFTDGTKNATDTGRGVDSSSTSIPIDSDTPEEYTGNSSDSPIGTPAKKNLSVTTESIRFAETSKSPLADFTSTDTSEEATITPELGSPSTSQDTRNIVTDCPTRSDLPAVVRIVFEGNWADVCPHLPTLRQSLADLLTSGLEKTVLASQIVFQKNPCTDGYAPLSTSTELSVTSLLLYVVDQNGIFDGEMTKILPELYSRSPIKLQVTIHSFQLVQDSDSGNAIAVVVVSSVAFICLVLLAGLLFIMRKRQTRFNYGERCRPVSLDAYSLDSVSAYNSVRRKGAARASKRSYGNPTFEDSSAIPSHPLNFGGLATFCNEQNTIAEEFAGIPQVTARIDELPPGAEVKNRYANVVPLPETRVSLMKINNDPLTEYINASYVRGPKNATKYYVACQAPIDSTVTDFWRMIWEQQSKVIIMLTDLVENGVEKCAEYIPPSEVTDCHRLYGDFQVTLKKRETKEKYAISTLHLKNLENNTFREISHIWYLWPANGVQTDAAGLIAVLLEARALQRGGPGPIVVHCSPGTGRSGTLIALDLGIRQYEITRTVDVPRVVYTIRRDRAGAVQTKEQYAFIYKALNLYATKLAGGALES